MHACMQECFKCYVYVCVYRESAHMHACMQECFKYVYVCVYRESARALARERGSVCVCRERETERERERERGGVGERESGREGEREKGRERESGAHKRGHLRMRVCKHAADSRRGRCYEKIWYLAYKLFRFHLNVAVDDEDVPRLRTHVCVRLAINNASSATVLYRTAWRAVTDTKLDGSPLINENLKGELPHPVYNMYVLIVDGEGDECSEHLGHTHDMPARGGWRTPDAGQDNQGGAFCPHMPHMS